MKIPSLTAESATGRALGLYASAAPPASAAGPAGDSLAPMGRLWRAMDNGNPFTIAQLIDMKDNGNGSPCGQDESVCWSTSANPLNQYDYICCNSSESCVQTANGDPACRLNVQKVAAIGSLPIPDPIKAEIRSYIN